MATERLDIVVPQGGERVVRRTLADVGASAQAAGRSADFLRRALGAAGLGLTARELLRQADTYTLLTNRLRLVTDSTADLADVNDALFRASQRTRQSYAATVDLYARLARNARALGLGQRELLAMTEAVTQAVAISGADAQSSSAALVQLGQALASGVLRGDEFNSITENTPRLAQAIADGLGVPLAALRGLAQDGQLTADAVTGALRRAAPGLAREFSQLSPTVAEASTVLGNALLRLVGEVNQSTGLSELLARGLVALASSLDAVAKAAAIAAAARFAGVFAARAAQAIALERALGASSGAAAALGAVLKVVHGAVRSAWALFAAAGGPFTLAAAALLGLYAFRDNIAVTADGVVSLGDVFRAVFDLAQGYIGGAVEGLGAVWEAGLARVSDGVGGLLDGIVSAVGAVVGFAQDAVNTYIGAWVGAYRSFAAAWGLFVPAMRDLGASLVNSLIDTVEAAIARLRSGVEGFGKLVEEFTGWNPAAPLLDRFQIDLSGLRQPVTGAARDLGAVVSAEMAAAMGTDYIGGAVGGVMDRAREVATARQAGGQTSPELLPASPAIPAAPDAGGPAVVASLSRQADMLEEIGGAAVDYREDLAALDALLASGQVTLDQYRAAYRDLRIAFLDAQTTLAAGVERGFLKVVRDIEDAAQTMEDLLTGTFKGAEDALVSWVRTGKLDFGNMVESLIADLTRLLIQRQVAAPLLSALGSALGIGFATGGSFTVPDAPRVPVPAQPERQATVRSEAATGSAPVKSQKTTVNVYGADDDAEVVESDGPNGLKIIDVYVDGRTPEKSQRSYPRH